MSRDDRSWLQTLNYFHTRSPGVIQQQSGGEHLSFPGPTGGGDCLCPADRGNFPGKELLLLMTPLLHLQCWLPQHNVIITLDTNYRFSSQHFSVSCAVPTVSDTLQHYMSPISQWPGLGQYISSRPLFVNISLLSSWYFWWTSHLSSLILNNKILTINSSSSLAFLHTSPGYFALNVETWRIVLKPIIFWNILNIPTTSLVRN